MAILNNKAALLVLVLSIFVIITIAESRPVFHGKLTSYIASLLLTNISFEPVFERIAPCIVLRLF